MPSSPKEHARQQAAEAIGFAALEWILSDAHRAARLLALTGLTPEQLREGLESPPILEAVFTFLANYEPDLVAAAQAIGQTPATIMAAAQDINQ